jgi:hypothetical protein
MTVVERGLTPAERSTPDVPGRGNEQLQFARLHIEPQAVVAVEGGEPALRTKPQAVEINDTGGLVDAALERVLGFELGNLGADQAEDGDGVLGQETQRREVSGARGVVLEQIAIDLEAAEDALGDGVVAAGAPGPPRPRCRGTCAPDSPLVADGSGKSEIRNP